MFDGNLRSHGSVENGITPRSVSWQIGFVFYSHDYGRKGSQISNLVDPYYSTTILRSQLLKFLCLFHYSMLILENQTSKTTPSNHLKDLPRVSRCSLPLHEDGRDSDRSTNMQSLHHHLQPVPVASVQRRPDAGVSFPEFQTLDMWTYKTHKEWTWQYEKKQNEWVGFGSFKKDDVQNLCLFLSKYFFVISFCFEVQRWKIQKGIPMNQSIKILHLNFHFPNAQFSLLRVYLEWGGNSCGAKLPTNNYWNIWRLQTPVNQRSSMIHSHTLRTNDSKLWKNTLGESQPPQKNQLLVDMCFTPFCLVNSFVASKPTVFQTPQGFFNLSKGHRLDQNRSNQLGLLDLPKYSQDGDLYLKKI